MKVSNRDILEVQSGLAIALNMDMKLAQDGSHPAKLTVAGKHNLVRLAVALKHSLKAIEEHRVAIALEQGATKISPVPEANLEKYKAEFEAVKDLEVEISWEPVTLSSHDQDVLPGMVLYALSPLVIFEESVECSDAPISTLQAVK